MYFSKFNKILYDPVGNGNYQQSVNILNSVLIQFRPAFDITLYSYYTIPDNYRPEDVSYAAYGDVRYTWLVILFNSIIDPYFDWPLTSSMLHEYCISKYDNKDAIHHFINLVTKDYVDDYDDTRYRDLLAQHIPLPHNISPVTNYEYEFDLNESRRDIKVMNKKYIRDISEQFEKLMKGK